MRQKLVLFCQLVLPVVIVLAMGIFQLVVRAANRRDSSRYANSVCVCAVCVCVQVA